MARREQALLQVLLRRPEPRFGLAVGLVVAVVLHLLAVPGASLLPGGGRKVQASPSSWGGLGARSLEQHVELVLKPPATTTPPPPPPPPEPEPEPLPKGQVVNLPAKKVERPDAADYLAEDDQRVERETRARVTGVTDVATRAPTVADAVDRAAEGAAEPAVEAPKTTPPKPGGEKADGGGVDGDAVAWEGPQAGGGIQALALLTPRREAVQGLKETRQGGSLRVQEEQRALDGNARAFRLAMGRIAPLQAPLGDGSVGSGFSRRGGTGDAGLYGQRAPTDGVGSGRSVTGLPRNDHLLVEEDNETGLNTWRFKHATYFNRIADAIRRTWVGGEVIGRVDPDHRLYGREDRTTRVQITLDRDGSVVDLALTNPSGVAALDDEALRAIRAAGPFPNPPRALFAEGDRFAFVFGFTIDFSRTSFDLNWAPY